MQRRLRALIVAVAVVSPCALAAQATQTGATMIRTARQVSNRAIAAHDTAAMASVQAPEYHGVSSRNAQSASRDEESRHFAELIASRPNVVFVRTPRDITVNEGWGQAGERGRWTGRWLQHDSLTRVGGEYYAKWTKVNGRWLILAEIFVQTTCAGSGYCTALPDMPPGEVR